MQTTRGPAKPRAYAIATTRSLFAVVPPEPPAIARIRYLAVLGTLFTLFSSARVLVYLPTIWAVMATGDSSQHSLWTWLTFFGGNSTMAAWLWEQNGRRCNAAIAASGSNALMCLAVIAVITWTRL